ncbi:MAG: hypothetical protein JSW54_03160 [Fidelibacterota bacterium]|nr:MAG: hypothetical protein JSW54_03160 [Candidatus Neomarinimicrobiota bacterium]
MVTGNPLQNPKSTPTKKDLEDFLGFGRYRRFDAIYRELVAMGLAGKFVWNDIDKNWSLHFYRGKTHIFSIRWGIDYFYSRLVLDSEVYKKVFGHKDLTDEACELLQRNPHNPTKRSMPVEANLEKIRDQDGFFELLPVLIKVLA